MRSPVNQPRPCSPTTTPRAISAFGSISVAAGHATLSMMVAETMVNGHGLCHGGYIFTLADTAFAYACNSYGQRTVAQHCEITFVAPGQRGMRLVAVAAERHRAGRSGIYDITVRDEAGQTIAEFRGLSRTIAGTLACELWPELWLDG